MPSVWVIEEGCYSDYRVVGVFTSEENADKVAAYLKSTGYSDATVAEWPLDPGVAEINAGLTRWHVQMTKEGTTEHVEQLDPTMREVLAEWIRIWKRSEAPAYKGKGIPDLLQADVWAKDAKHAIKITNEHRVRMIASGEFS